MFLTPFCLRIISEYDAYFYTRGYNLTKTPTKTHFEGGWRGEK